MPPILVQAFEERAIRLPGELSWEFDAGRSRVLCGEDVNFQVVSVDKRDTVVSTPPVSSIITTLHR
jgi:hypothetical protein